jgi:UDP-glucose 4-epimerase
MVNLLVTGSSGYIGSATIEHLKNSEFNVFEIDIDGKFNLLDFNELKSFFYKNNIEIVLHLAAFKSIPDSKNNPIVYLHNNICSSLNLISVCEELNIPIVNASSASVYNDTNPYSQSKILVEKFLDQSRLSYINLRYFNIGGLIEKPNSRQVSNIFDVIRSKYLNNEKFIINAGDSIRNYTHVKDIAKFNVKCLRDLFKSNYRKTMDVYTNNSASVQDLLAMYDFRGVSLDYALDHAQKPQEAVLPKGEGLIVDSISLDDIIESEIKYGIRLDNRI